MGGQQGRVRGRYCRCAPRANPTPPGEEQRRLRRRCARGHWQLSGGPRQVSWGGGGGHTEHATTPSPGPFRARRQYPTGRGGRQRRSTPDSGHATATHAPYPRRTLRGGGTRRDSMAARRPPTPAERCTGRDTAARRVPRGGGSGGRRHRGGGRYVFPAGGGPERGDGPARVHGEQNNMHEPGDSPGHSDGGERWSIEGQPCTRGPENTTRDQRRRPQSQGPRRTHTAKGPPPLSAAGGAPPSPRPAASSDDFGKPRPDAEAGAATMHTLPRRHDTQPEGAPERRPGDLFLPTWADGRPVAIDFMVTSRDYRKQARRRWWQTARADILLYGRPVCTGGHCLCASGVREWLCQWPDVEHHTPARQRTDAVSLPRPCTRCWRILLMCPHRPPTQRRLAHAGPPVCPPGTLGSAIGPLEH
eukprot:gene23411-biopygen11833